MTDDRNLRIPEAAGLLSLSESMVKRLIQHGKLVSYKVGTARLIPYSAVQDYIAEQKRLAILAADGDAEEPRRMLRRMPLRGA